MSFLYVLRFGVCFSPYFLAVEDETWEKKQNLAHRCKGKEKVAGLVRKVKVLPEEVCFHVHRVDLVVLMCEIFSTSKMLS